jgi:hypothetical protein
LERLESQGILALPAKRASGTPRPGKRVSAPVQVAVLSKLTGSVEQFAPIKVELVQSHAQRWLFCDLFIRYIMLNQTSGQGPMDRNHERHGAQDKTVLVYPLVKAARQRLTAGRTE